MDFAVYNSLEDAILAISYNPFAATYCDLTEEETKAKDILLEKYIWTPQTGLVEKAAP